MAKHHETEARERLLSWINGTLTARGWKAYNWTLKAGLADTSLTRFLNRPSTAPLPSATTIVALAQAADSNPILLPEKKIALGRNIPLLDGKLLTLMVSCPHPLDTRTVAEEIGQLTDRRVSVVAHAASDQAFAVEVETRSMNAAGILPGDHLIVEPTALCPPRLGDTVVVLTPEGRVQPMRYQTPWLVCVSTDPECGSVLLENTAVHGVVTAMSRPLKRGTPVILFPANGKTERELA
jgi:hypothetical protein